MLVGNSSRINIVHKGNLPDHCSILIKFRFLSHFPRLVKQNMPFGLSALDESQYFTL